MKIKNTILLAATMVGAAAADSANNDLLNVLQKKGLLSEAEVQSLRDEQKKNVKPASPAWVNNTRISGDFRGRFEGLYASDPAFQDRSRFRYRLRAGLASTVSEHFDVGFRLASGEAAAGVPGGDPIGTNSSLQDNASKKLIFVDMAYAKWRPTLKDNWSGALTVGKMENPFSFSDLIFDADYTPEGAAQQLNWKIDERHTAAFTAGEFVLDGTGSFDRDAFMVGAQARLDSKWNKQWQSSAGVAALVLFGEDQLVNGAVPNQNRGNSRPQGNFYGPGALSESYAPLVVDASVTYSLTSFPLYQGSFPIKLAADYMYNGAADDRNQAASIGLTFGKAGKKGQWEVGYRWKYLEGDAWYEEVVDSDFGAFYKASADTGGAAGYSAGTNVRGHVLKAAYSISDSFTIGASAMFTELIEESPSTSDSRFIRIQFDTVWKF